MHAQMYDKDDSGQIEFPEFLLMFRNSLLDLKDMTTYMTLDEAGAGSSGSLVDVSAAGGGLGWRGEGG